MKEGKCYENKHDENLHANNCLKQFENFHANNCLKQFGIVK